MKQKSADCPAASVSSILDLNGSGRIEIVIYRDYDGRSPVEVFEIIRGKALEVQQLSVKNGGEWY
ncbi:MAG TPA: hypothetical protein VGC97_08355 [Pyrinomonadaceae bacterium]